jgi:hypothetical protein
VWCGSCRWRTLSPWWPKDIGKRSRRSRKSSRCLTMGVTAMFQAGQFSISSRSLSIRTAAAKSPSLETFRMHLHKTPKR